MMTIIKESLQYIRIESYKVPSRVEYTLKRKNMGHISKFQFRAVCIQSKEHTNLFSNISTLIILSKNRLRKIHVEVTQYL